MVELSFVIKEW